MKKLVIICSVATLLALGACAFHSKQPVDPEYYKKTQQVAWPEESTSQPSRATKTTKATASTSDNAGYVGGGSGGSTGVPSASAADRTKWEDAAEIKQVAVPEMAEKKVQCTKTNNGTYTCRYGQTVCGWGCRADGSNCSVGYCQKSECDDVMGQKWEWIKVGFDKETFYACKHPDYNVTCAPSPYEPGILCSHGLGYLFWGKRCGYNCNKNGTDCGGGNNNCWDKYR